MNKKLRIILLSVIAFLILSLTTTYGLWYVTKNQTNSNIIVTKCLDISLTNEQNDITLTEAYPITDEEGMKLTPFTFTVTNNCNTSIDYQLNLELLGDKNTSVSSSAIKVSLNDNTTLLSNKETLETTIENAFESYQLMYGRLNVNESEDYSLRLWVDENALVNESNKVFESKISIIAGQGIENPFEEGTLGFNIIGKVGGSGNISELSAQWQEGEWSDEQAVKIYDSWEYYWGTNYVFDSEKGYILSGDIVLATPIECREGTKKCGEYTIKFTESTIVPASDTLYKVISFDNSNGQDYFTAKQRKAFNNFSSVTTAEYAKLHKTEDDLGASYYFRGAVENNYVKFGKWSENASEVRGIRSGLKYFYDSLEECNAASSYNECSIVQKEEAGKDMYWRIIRVNGDGTIRMIYDGVELFENGVKHTANIGESAYNDPERVDYTFMGEDNTQKDSTIKHYLDFWYNQNLKANYGSYIADSIFCNDRTIVKEISDYYQYKYYGAYSRLNWNRTPALICEQKEDQYTMSTKIGNGYLTNPVGLITADEAALAGGVSFTQNNTYYLAGDRNMFWMMSPFYSYVDTYYNRNGAFIWSLYENGTIYAASSVGWPAYYARPVINLKADVKFTGEGTIDNPYEIVVE